MVRFAVGEVPFQGRRGTQFSVLFQWQPAHHLHVPCVLAKLLDGLLGDGVRDPSHLLQQFRHVRAHGIGLLGRTFTIQSLEFQVGVGGGRHVRYGSFQRELSIASFQEPFQTGDQEPEIGGSFVDVDGVVRQDRTQFSRHLWRGAGLVDGCVRFSEVLFVSHAHHAFQDPSHLRSVFRRVRTFVGAPVTTPSSQRLSQQHHVRHVSERGFVQPFQFELVHVCVQFRPWRQQAQVVRHVVGSGFDHGMFFSSDAHGGHESARTHVDDFAPVFPADPIDLGRVVRSDLCGEHECESAEEGRVSRQEGVRFFFDVAAGHASVHLLQGFGHGPGPRHAFLFGGEQEIVPQIFVLDALSVDDGERAHSSQHEVFQRF
eukprot:scaffold598_cov318-Pavlova_lutheri.AAC.16